MIILGLTGSIGMGKTTAANNFKSFGIPVHDSDAAIHELCGPRGAAVDDISSAFPTAVSNGTVDRGRLAAIVFYDRQKLTQLEAILHPYVWAHKHKFLAYKSRGRSKLVVLDIPLLFETGGDRYCDGVVTVSAPPFIQAARVLARPGMTQEKMNAILERQMPDAEKCRRADFVLRTGLGRIESFRAVHRILEEARKWRGRHWPPSCLPISGNKAGAAVRSTN